MRGGLKLGFLASHRGSSMRAILDAIASGKLRASASVVISNNADAPALAYAAALGIPAYHLSETRLGGVAAADQAIAEALALRGAELVILSGYMRKLGPATLARFPGRILNIHPGPLPRYGGAGMYGRRVHEAVIAAGERLSAITIHLVDGEYDHGPVIARREVAVESGDTAASLAARIEAQEPPFFVETLRRISEGELRLPAPEGGSERTDPA
ncbi:MAG TPA: phosphoribosylglycinamide formyltransferase [Stellaceae bacterium]|jgi:phosphoribosylglycinamide formyltransferase-1|nr:phosphoribosylglycinamide formyltransferase [Stellaceae bacterium]